MIFFYRLNHTLIDWCLIDWLIYWLIWLIDWLVDWLIDWLIGWLLTYFMDGDPWLGDLENSENFWLTKVWIFFLIDRCMIQLNFWLSDWLIDWLIGCLVLTLKIMNRDLWMGDLQNSDNFWLRKFLTFFVYWMLNWLIDWLIDWLVGSNTYFTDVHLWPGD